MKSSTVACAYPNPYHTRLYHILSDKQHIGFCISLRGQLCPRTEIVDIILHPEPGVHKTVLDIG